MAPHVRAADQMEIWAQVGLEPELALRLAIRGPGEHHTALLNDRVVAIFGVVPDADGGGSIWLIGTDAIRENADLFHSYVEKWLGSFKERFSRLYNWVDARNEVSLKWAESVGMKVFPPVPFGVQHLPFHYVEWRAE